MSNHTPGPWRAVETYVYSPENRNIAQTNPLIDQPVSCANARLIAAALELLEALTALLDEAEDIFVCMADATGINRHTLPPQFVAARAAIAKAEGHGL